MVGGEVGLGQLPLDVHGLLDRSQRLFLTAQPREERAEVEQRGRQVGLVGGGVRLGQLPEQAGGLLGWRPAPPRYGPRASSARPRLISAAARWGGLGGGVLGGQSPVQVGGLPGDGQGLLLAVRIGQHQAEVGQRSRDVAPVGGGVVGWPVAGPGRVASWMAASASSRRP